MYVQPYTMLSPRELKPASGMDPSAGQPSIEVLRKECPIDPSKLRVTVDATIAFNELVDGLFNGQPPWCMEHLFEAVEVSKKYQEVADILKQSTDIDGYYRFAQAASFLKKFEGMDDVAQQDAESVTLEKWVTSEEICKIMNEKLWAIKNAPISLSSDPLAVLLIECREEIRSLLGDFPPEFSEVARFGKFGPGVTLSHKITERDPLLKTINPSALTSQESEVKWLLAASMMGYCVADSRLNADTCRLLGAHDRFRVALDGIDWVDFERYATVPKSVEERRSIGVGASLATWIQQAYDGWIRNALLGWGIDLSDQDPNRSLAYLGSLPETADRPCTIDLTDASNRIALGLVVGLLPTAWSRCLIRQRASFCKLPDGSSVRQEKFSAMGNALTFSLQSLIFSSVVRVVLRTHGLRNARWRVYGDDIIVPYSVFDDVVSALRRFGFEPNMKKSFKEGNFRESCGADYLRGTKVRPLYLKKPIMNVCELYKTINLVQLFAAESPIPVNCYTKVYKYLVSCVPEDFRIFGEPSEVLDGYIWAPLSALPRRILGRVAHSEELPEKWAYYRTLLVGAGSDSHIRKGRGFYRDNYLYPRVVVTGHRSGIVVPGEKWRWCRVLYIGRKRLDGLRDKLTTLFIGR
jgi:hypothetical protein